MNTNVIYETGATSEKVNNLILFTDTTQQLAAIRDRIYTSMVHFENMNAANWLLNQIKWDCVQFMELLDFAITRYKIEIDRDIPELSRDENYEYCLLYLKDFDNWKSEYRYK